jgi:hypothetical protein
MGGISEVAMESYRQHLPSLHSQDGKFALIHDNRLVGIFDSYEGAFRARQQKCGPSPFLSSGSSATEQSPARQLVRSMNATEAVGGKQHAIERLVQCVAQKLSLAQLMREELPALNDELRSDEDNAADNKGHRLLRKHP